MNAPEDKTLLLVEDDRPLRERLARALETRGFIVTQAESVAEGKAHAKDAPPAVAEGPVIPAFLLKDPARLGVRAAPPLGRVMRLCAQLRERMGKCLL